MRSAAYTIPGMQADPPSSTAVPAPPVTAFDRFFGITARGGSSVAREVRGGLVTFFSMCYIVVLNPLIIGTVPPDSTGTTSAEEQNRTWQPSPRALR